jgi:hypothetical protein
VRSARMWSARMWSARMWSARTWSARAATGFEVRGGQGVQVGDGNVQKRGRLFAPFIRESVRSKAADLPRFDANLVVCDHCAELPITQRAFRSVTATPRTSTRGDLPPKQ